MRQLTLAAVLATLLAGCATAKVDTEFNPKAEFAAYRTYAWLDTSGGKEVEALRYPESAALVRSAVDRELPRRGLERVDGGQPDLLVAVHGQGKERIELTSYTYGQSVGPYGYSGPITGAPVATSATERRYTEGTLLLDLVDARTKELVWRGTASDVVTGPDRLRTVIDGAVKQLLAEYPPKPRP